MNGQTPRRYFAVHRAMHREPTAPVDRKWTRESGASLTELMIGLLVCVFVVGSALAMTVHQARLRKADGELNLAMLACRNSLEELRSLDFLTLPSMDGVGFDVPGPNGEPLGLTPVAGDTDGLAGEFAITVDKTTGTAILYRVKAMVVWTGSLDRQTFELSTIMGPRL